MPLPIRSMVARRLRSLRAAFLAGFERSEDSPQGPVAQDALGLLEVAGFVAHHVFELHG